MNTVSAALKEKHAALWAERDDASRRVAELVKRVKEIDVDLAGLVKTASLFGEELEPGPSLGTPKVRDYVIEQLSKASVGLRAREIRLNYESAYNTTLHPKTIGMTLHRLKAEGITRLDGNTWFGIFRG